MTTSWARPLLSGFLDYRYMWAQETYSGAGTFQVNNLNLAYTFLLNKSYKIFLQTNIAPGSNNSQIIKQLHLDTEFAKPFQLRLGRFKVETMERDFDQDKNNFISGPIFWDLNWGMASNPVLPDNEVGVNLYTKSRNNELQLYVVNGSNEWTETNTVSKKSFGAYFRTLFRNIVEFRGSIYSNMYDAGSYNHTAITTEALFSILDIDIKGGGLIVLGENNGTSDNAVGGLLEMSLPISKTTRLSGLASLYKNDGYYYRGALALRSSINQDMIWKNEICVEKNDTTNIRDYKFQSQIVVRL